MKKLIAILLAIVAIGAQADDFTYKYLVMSESDGAKTSLDVEGPGTDLRQWSAQCQEQRT